MIVETIQIVHSFEIKGLNSNQRSGNRRGLNNPHLYGFHPEGNVKNHRTNKKVKRSKPCASTPETPEYPARINRVKMKADKFHC
jgi:hypothetical protein